MKKKYVMIVASGFIRPDLRILLQIRNSIKKTWMGPAKIFWSSKGLERLNSRRHSAVILLFNSQSINGHEMDRLRKFIHAGGGAFFLNKAVSSQNESNVFSDIIGASFKGSRELSEFSFSPNSKEDGFTCSDSVKIVESYSIFDLGENAQERSQVSYSDGQTYPCSWTHTFGKGRIFCFIPGERVSTYRQKILWTHMREGFRWICRLNDNP